MVPSLLEWRWDFSKLHGSSRHTEFKLWRLLMARPIFSFLCGLFAGVLVFSQAHAGEVKLEQCPNSVVVRIDGEVFTVLHTSKDWKKPFFYPVTAAGGIEQLAKDVGEPSGEPGLPGSRVLICTENAVLKVDDKETTGQLALDEEVEVREVKRPWLYVPEKKGWVHERDVAPLGSTVTRVIQKNPVGGLDKNAPLYYDHPHHKGIWFTIDEVNDVRFWAEKGIIRNISVTIDEAQGESARMTIVNHWLDKDDSPLLKETTHVGILADHTLVYDFELTAVSKPVTFNDTKEGLFGIRLPNSMRENSGGGPVANAEGLATTANCWGKHSLWVDYAGPVGKRKLAVTIFDHPASYKKSRYHVRDYGLFSVSPFGDNAYTNGAEPKAPLTLETGKSVNLRYGLHVRDYAGNAEAAGAAYQKYLAIPR